MSKMGTIDLCCGMGGLSYAAQKAGLSVWAGVDIFKNALSSFKTNFPRALTIYGDISGEHFFDQHLQEINSIRCKADGLVIISGPPCQGFSEAGSRRADDPRNEVLVSVAKAIVRFKPEAAIIENVAALRRAKNSKVLRRFRAMLNTAGYHVYGFELNALDFGAPQKRRRMIYFVLPFAVQKRCITESLKTFHKSAEKVKTTIGDLPVPLVRPFDYDPAEDTGTPMNHYAMRHSERVKKKIAMIEPGKGPLSYRKLNPDSYAATLLSGHRAPPVHYDQPRSITVREALRLQGFPDVFRVMGPFGNQMEQVTNAVPVQLGEAVISVLLKLLGENK